MRLYGDSRARKVMRNNGLLCLLNRYTLQSWEQKEAWQQVVHESAARYVKDHGTNWFMMSGRTGIGKTHICTAISGELMKNGLPVKYMLWRDVSVLAKAVVNDDEEYFRVVNPLKNAPVLYIDDLFKAGKDDARGDEDNGPG